MERPPSPTNNKSTIIKFTCSYGGKIMPRHPHGQLRYHGGHTRVLSVHRSISFSELMKKMSDLSNTSANLRCQLPTEDLDALVSIRSDEDLTNLIEEYDRMTSSSLKIRSFLFPTRSPSKNNQTPPASEYAVTSSPSPKSLSPSSSFNGNGTSPRFAPVMPMPMPMLMCYRKYGSDKVAVAQPPGHYGCHHCYCRNPSHMYLVHSGGRNWQ